MATGDTNLFTDAAKIIQTNKDELAKNVTHWVTANYPKRTTEYDKCTRDVGYIITALIYCLKDGNITAIDNISRMFFNMGKLQLKSLYVEFEAYSFLIEEMKKLIVDAEEGAGEHCALAISRLKQNLGKETEIWATNNDELYTDDRELRIKHIMYSWNEEQTVMRKMQQCQRNYNLSYKMMDEAADYLLWVAQNVPSKQYEAYFDVYYTTDRATIDYLYQFSWGSTHSRTPPSCWRNSQMNANMYMIFVCKTPDTMYNCNNDGTDQDSKGESRWENSFVSVGMAMGLVMRAANKMGFRTGPNKIKDLGPDYNFEWEKQLGILDDVKSGNKRLFYGLGIGITQGDRPRWESDDTELALGASNGHNITTKHNDPDFDPLMPTRKDGSPGQEKRKVKIIDIKTASAVETDPYGNVHTIPEKHEIKINTQYNRDIKLVEIPKVKNS